jgi:hypothetical protein
MIHTFLDPSVESQLESFLSLIISFLVQLQHLLLPSLIVTSSQVRVGMPLPLLSCCISCLGPEGLRHLYSLHAHLKQPGCGFFGTFEAGMLVNFPTFVLSVDTSTDCYLSYEPLGCSAPLSTLYYVQPRCALTLYPSEVSPSTCNAMPVPAPVLVADDDSSFVDAQPPPLHDNMTSILSTAPSIVSPPGGSSLDISLLATQLWALADSVHSMTRNR